MKTINGNPVDYIGDGVYVKHDGFGVLLMANDPYNPTDMVYLEPEVYEALGRFINRVATNKEGGGK